MKMVNGEIILVESKSSVNQEVNQNRSSKISEQSNFDFVICLGAALYKATKFIKLKSRIAKTMSGL